MKPKANVPPLTIEIPFRTQQTPSFCKISLRGGFLCFLYVTVVVTTIKVFHRFLPFFFFVFCFRYNLYNLTVKKLGTLQPYCEEAG